MTTPATPSAPTLLGKLRALEERIHADDGSGEWSHDDDDDCREAIYALADLLPGVITELERIANPIGDDSRLERTMDAIAQALGDAYDCTRVWSAWQVGTMSEDDFVPIVEQPDRLAEIAQAAINAAQPVQPSADPPEPYQASDDNDWSPCEIYV